VSHKEIEPSSLISKPMLLSNSFHSFAQGKQVTAGKLMDWIRQETELTEWAYQRYLSGVICNKGGKNTYHSFSPAGTEDLSWTLNHLEKCIQGFILSWVKPRNNSLCPGPQRRQKDEGGESWFRAAWTQMPTRREGRGQKAFPSSRKLCSLTHAWGMRLQKL
jgi:hypothetical protein